MTYYTPRTDEFFHERTREPSVHAWLKYARRIERELTDSNAELRRLQAENAELLKALKWLKNFLGGKHMPECVSRIHDAIAKAEGK